MADRRKARSIYKNDRYNQFADAFLSILHSWLTSLIGYLLPRLHPLFSHGSNSESGFPVTIGYRFPLRNTRVH